MKMEEKMKRQILSNAFCGRQGVCAPFFPKNNALGPEL